MRIIDSYQPGANFWELHPHFLAINPFKKIYDEDTSANHKNSSDLIWFVVFCYDFDSKFEVLEKEEKHSIVGEDFCNNKNYYRDNKETIDEVKVSYCKTTDTAAKRSLRQWKDKLEERDTFIASTPFTMDSYDDRGKVIKGTADQLDSMMARTPKLWADYERIMKDIEKEESGGGESRGGSTPSASDEGDI